MTNPSLRPRLPLLSAGQLACVLLSVSSPSLADNPIVQHIFTADPAPMVHGDTVYLYTSHDEDVTVNNFFTMNDWRVWSSKDMVNWTDHGSPLSYHSFSWATGKAWAPHCIERNGRFYLYVPVSDAIGVAVADSPTGPFEDAIGRPLVSNYQYIDPTVFVDDDGQAYLYFGNPKLWYVRLNDDMISHSGQVEQIPMTTESFGQRNGDAERPTLYEEGPWFYKRDDLYHMMFAMGPLPEKIGYSTSSDPLGPWTYQKVIMESQSGHAFTNHAGVVDFKGHSYFFYHTQELSGDGYKRSVAVEEFSYNADGSFPTITKTSEGVTDSVQPLNPFQQTEAETIAWESGIETETCSEGGMTVTSIDNGDTIKVEQVEFGSGATTLDVRVASPSGGGTIELRLDGSDGTLVGTCMIASTGGDQSWATQSCSVDGATGQHDLYLKFTGGGFKFNWWKFSGPGDPGTGGTGGAGGEAGAPGFGGNDGGTAGEAGGADNGGTAGGGTVAGAPGLGGSLGGNNPGLGGAEQGGSSGGSVAGAPWGTGGNPAGAAAGQGGATNGGAGLGGTPVGAGGALARGGNGGIPVAVGGNAPGNGGSAIGGLATGGGVGVAGVPTGGNTVGNGGLVGTSGGLDSAGATTADNQTPKDESGCSCRTGGGQQHVHWSAALWLLTLFVARGRRRRV